MSEFYSFIFLCSICYPSCVLFVFLNAIDQLMYRLFLNILLVSVILFNKKMYMCVWKRMNELLSVSFFSLFVVYYWISSVKIVNIFPLRCSLFFFFSYVDYYLDDIIYTPVTLFLSLYFLLFSFFWLLKNHSNKD